MSIGIATMGYFNPLGAGGDVVGGGGAPPYKQNADEEVIPTIRVSNVEMITIDSSNNLLDKIQIKLKDDVVEIL